MKIQWLNSSAGFNAERPNLKARAYYPIDQKVKRCMKIQWLNSSAGFNAERLNLKACDYYPIDQKIKRSVHNT